MENTLFECIENNETSLFFDMVKNGASIDVRDSHGNTLLHEAVSYENEEITKFLIENRVDVNAIDYEFHYTPLFFAIENISVKFTDLLLKNGANPNIQSESGHYPIHLSSNEEITSLLIKSGADINTKDSDGYTVLYYAKEYYLEIYDEEENGPKQFGYILFLLNNGADHTVLTRENFFDLLENEDLVNKILECVSPNIKDPGFE